jgi:hypothetical protein
MVERLMRTPLVSVAQVRMLSEGLVQPAPPCATLPADLAPKIPFSEKQIRSGLPLAGSFRLRDLRCCFREKTPEHSHPHHVFLEMP